MDRCAWSMNVAGRTMMTALKTLIFTVLVPGTVAILIPYRIVSSAVARGPISTGSLHYFGLLVIPAASSYRVIRGPDPASANTAGSERPCRFSASAV
jgi:hypothetical protein